MRISNMKIDGVKEPLGFAADHPSLSLTVEGTESRDFAAGEIIVARDENFSDIV